MDEVEWELLHAETIRAAAAEPGTIVILPVGSLEQHGPHLPVITDTRTASAIAVRIARLAGGSPRMLVLPGMWTGMSEHHFPFGGTISLNYPEFHGVLRGVARSLRALGFARLLLLNGHGGNVDPLAVSARELAHEFGFPVVATTPWYAEADAVAPLLETARTAGHACEAETSVMLALTPQRVGRERFDEAVRQAPARIDVPAGYSRFLSFAERAPATGTRGDPRAASAEKGERLLDALAEATLARLRDPVLWRAPDDVWSAGRGQGSTVP